ncbi:NTP transferase domain-containing protein [Shewanella cyperi]|uniref:NTP transferase domain-containing protein n=1 Tax=Shewanella cyperi TaxID=2814292 RepID=UPI001A947C4B|nr:NTP transferase domain-containing protein [Shewanella cyperi]QSX41116.1 NTP transferase domain-containing protein [Shewanella cyperi]
MTQVLTLVILAAGMGSRFGGDKQLAELGPRGESLLLLSLRQAFAAGFRRAVLVIRPELEAQLLASLQGQLPDELELHCCFQRLDDLPASVKTAPWQGRSKPWGTAHALWSARHLVSGPMAVITADDFYCADAFAQLALGLRNSDNWMLVAYRLGNTLSEHGGVNRGLCREADGWLQDIRECLAIEYIDGQLQGKLAGNTVALSADMPVSMTSWGFQADIFPRLESALTNFFKQQPQASSECFLPDVVQEAMACGQPVRLATARDIWLGVTFPGDAPRVRQALMELLGD